MFHSTLHTTTVWFMHSNVFTFHASVKYVNIRRQYYQLLLNFRNERSIIIRHGVVVRSVHHRFEPGSVAQILRLKLFIVFPAYLQTNDTV